VLRWVDPIASLRALSDSFTLVATAHDAKESLYLCELPKRCVFLMGAEGTGLSAKVRALASTTIAIRGTGAVESLNVSTAAAVLLGEHWRRFGR
jgi:TrmH RNA methyltransferase